jgi:endonuclease YncB( thermonuclease family)
MPHRTLPRFVALIAFAWASPASAEDFTGKVVGISDGDTLTVLRGRTSVKIRLHGIDAPEAGQDFGTRAKQAASDLAFGKVVTVRPVTTDRYGRTVALVVLPDGRTLNHELVRSGFAWWFQKYALAPGWTDGGSAVEGQEGTAANRRRPCELLTAAGRKTDVAHRPWEQENRRMPA